MQREGVVHGGPWLLDARAHARRARASRRLAVRRRAKVGRGATLVWWSGARWWVIVGGEAPALTDQRKDTRSMSHRSITILAIGAAAAALAPASAALAQSAASPASNSGVP